MYIEELTEPEEEIISLEEAKRHLRIEDDYIHEDVLIESYISAARSYLETINNKLYGVRKLKMTLPGFEDAISIHRGPVVEIKKIEYIDTEENQVELDSEKYVYHGQFPTVIVPYFNKAFPTTKENIDSVFITYRAGEKAVKHTIHQACLILVAHFFENREYSLEKQLFSVPLSVKNLAATDKRYIWA